MGRTSWAPFGKACKAAPARCWAMSGNASPRTNNCTTSVSWTASSSPWGEARASWRWLPRRPEGPAALPRLKERMARTTSSTPNSGTAAKPGRPRATRAGLAGAARGCFSCSLAATAPVLFSKDGEVKAAQARESSPSAASEQQRLCRADRASALCISSGRLRRVAGMASHNSSRSPASLRAQRRWVNWAACRRCRRPPRGAGRSTALGSMKRSRQACKLLVLAICARARERHWAQTARAALGTCRGTGVFAAQAVSKEGPATAGAAAAGAAAAARRAAGRQAAWISTIVARRNQPPAHRAQVKVLAGTVSLRDVPIKRRGRVVLEMGPHSGMAGPAAAARHAGRASWDRAENAVRGALAGRGRTFPARAARSVDCHGLPLAAQRCARGRWPRVGRLADAAASKAAASAESLHPTMRRMPGHPRGPMPTPRRGRERPPPHGKQRRASRPSNQKRWCESSAAGWPALAAEIVARARDACQRRGWKKGKGVPQRGGPGARATPRDGSAQAKKHQVKVPWRGAAGKYGQAEGARQRSEDVGPTTRRASTSRQPPKRTAGGAGRPREHTRGPKTWGPRHHLPAPPCSCKAAGGLEPINSMESDNSNN